MFFFFFNFYSNSNRTFCKQIAVSGENNLTVPVIVVVHSTRPRKRKLVALLLVAILYND